MPPHNSYALHACRALRSTLRVVTEVARSLEFSPLMHSLADRVIAAIGARSPEYNAVHLRIEKDARDWSQIMGGPEVSQTLRCTHRARRLAWSELRQQHAELRKHARAAGTVSIYPFSSLLEERFVSCNAVTCVRASCQRAWRIEEAGYLAGLHALSASVSAQTGVCCAQAVWNAYVLSMRQAGFTSAVPMYAASGLLTYGASEDMDHIIATLKAAGLCSEVLYKELYIPQPELDGARPRLPLFPDTDVISSLLPHTIKTPELTRHVSCAPRGRSAIQCAVLRSVELRTEGVARLPGAGQGQALRWLWLVDVLFLSGECPCPVVCTH